MGEARTIVDHFLRQVKIQPNEVAICFKQNAGGDFVERTWLELHRDVQRVGLLLQERGIQPGDRIAQLSENRYEWVLIDLAALSVGAVHVPLHATLSADQAAYQIDHSESRLLFISSQEQDDKLADVSSPLASLEAIFSFDSVSGSARMLETELPSLGSENLDVHHVADPTTELATMIYTSGTTGEPKGVMLSHSNLTSNAEGTSQSYGLGDNELQVGFLPLSHIFARTCDLYVWLILGGRLAIAESRETVIQDCQTNHPTYLNGVPYFFDKVAQAISSAGHADTPGALRETLGGQIAFCNSGGAPLPEHIYDFYAEQGVPILQGYGLTESSPVISCSTTQYDRRGCIGKPIPGVEVEIHDGEIVTRGPHVMLGYWRNQQATNEIIRDGWLHTGDLGELDDDGFLRITGRSKELIVTAGGKNIAPMLIESLIMADELIDQVLVIGDNRKYLIALIVPNFSQLGKHMDTADLSVKDLFCDEHLLELVQQTLNNRLQRLSRHEQIARFVLLEDPFSIERGELTAKLSLRRTVIADHYAETIESLYGS